MKDAGKKPAGKKPEDETSKKSEPRKSRKKLFLILLPIIIIAAAIYLYTSGKLDFTPKWYIMGTDTCAPVSKANKKLLTPQDVEENYVCQMIDAKKIYGAKKENLYVLDCKASMKMNLILVEGEKNCQKTLDKLHGRKTIVEKDGFDDVFTEMLSKAGISTKDIRIENSFQNAVNSAENMATPAPVAAENPAEDWYVLTAANECKLPTNIDTTAKTMTDFYNKFSCVVITTQKLFGAQKPNYYHLHCPNYNQTESEVIFIKGKSACERNMQAAANQGMENQATDYTSSDWFVMALDGCKPFSYLDPNAATPREMLDRYSCTTANDVGFPNTFSMTCPNTQGKLLLISGQQNCYNILPLALEKNKNYKGNQ